MQDNENIASKKLRALDRAVHELRSGYPVLVREGSNGWLVRSAEAYVADIGDDEGGVPEELVLSAARMHDLGLIDTPDAKSYALPYASVKETGLRLAEVIEPRHDAGDRFAALKDALRPAAEGEYAALNLLKLAALLPAVLVNKLDAAACEQWQKNHHILALDAQDVDDYHALAAQTLSPVSEANVPLECAEDARVIAFRPRYGALEHLAIVIGQPDQQEAPLIRLHSSCVTGDILGSLRCDCGDQLKEAIAQVAQEGAGVVLYLSQEGRGIGISNKLRAYQLQDGGLDTVDANEAMGFAADERCFAPAAAMLKKLGIHTVRLLTNNPKKVEELEQAGVKVSERVGLVMPKNPHNERYLETKEKRCGHIF